jgi:hypothetical protein
MRLGRQVIVWSAVAALTALALPGATSSSAAPVRPVVTAVRPISGSTSGRAHVIVEGRGFTRQSVVYFGGVRSGTVRVMSPDELVAYAPPQAHALVHVIVHTISGASPKSASSHYRYIHPTLPPAWTDAKAPSPAGLSAKKEQRIEATDCPSARCYFVGEIQTGQFEDAPVIGTYDGSSTSEILAPSPDGQPYAYGATLTHLSCPSVTFCVAAGMTADHAAVLLTLSGGTWTAITAPLPPGTPAAVQKEYVNDLSCGAPGDCVAVGYVKYRPSELVSVVLTLHDGAWTSAVAPHPRSSTSYRIENVACAGASWCLMTGSYRELIVDRAGRYSSEPMTDPPGAEWAGRGRDIEGLSCPAVSECTLLTLMQAHGQHRTDFLTMRHGVLAYHRFQPPADSQDAAGFSYPDVPKLGFSCPSAKTCFATVAYSGLGVTDLAAVARVNRDAVRVYVMPQLRDEQHHPPVVIDALDCSSATACVAVGHHGFQAVYETFANGVWTPRAIGAFADQPASAHLRLDQVSCVPSGHCLATGGYTYVADEAAGGHSHLYGTSFVAMGADR